MKKYKKLISVIAIFIAITLIINYYVIRLNCELVSTDFRDIILSENDVSKLCVHKFCNGDIIENVFRVMRSHTCDIPQDTIVVSFSSNIMNKDMETVEKYTIENFNIDIILDSDVELKSIVLDDGRILYDFSENDKFVHLDSGTEYLYIVVRNYTEGCINFKFSYNVKGKGLYSFRCFDEISSDITI